MSAAVLARGERVVLRPLDAGDVGPRYLGWMNDAEVVRHTESSVELTGGTTAEGLRTWVESCLSDARVVLAAIELADTGEHIGNIKLGPVDEAHSTASIGIIIGEKAHWGRGLATEAIGLMAAHAFGQMGLFKVTAGCYGANRAAVRAFEKAGFAIEGVQREQCAYQGGRTDKILLGRLNTDRTGDHRHRG